MDANASHRELATSLRTRVMNSGIIDATVRNGALALGGGEAAEVPEPIRSLAGQVGQASYRVTDLQVAEVRDAVGSDKAAFEVIMAASIGAGLRRWESAIDAIEDATSASP